MRSKRKRLVGRPRHEPTEQSREIVEALAGYGIPQEKIASVLRISKPTLHEAYRAELDRGTAVVEANLVGNLLRLAKGKDGTALKAIIFSLQARFGWSLYAPPPAVESEPLGKKEAAQREAQTAHEDSSWGNLLN